MAIKKKKERVQFTSSLKKPELAKIPFFRLFIIACVINLINITLIVVFVNKLPPELPIYYGLPEGESQLGSSLHLLIPSIISLAVIILNTAISLTIKDSFFKQALSLASFTSAILSTIATLKIALLVGNF